MKRALLLSGSKHHGNPLGSGYLQWAREELSDFLDTKFQSSSGGRRILFVPYANPDGMGHDDYASFTIGVLDGMGYGGARSLHEARTPAERTRMLGEAGAIFVGGGNTFRLVRAMRAADVKGLDLEGTSWLDDDAWFSASEGDTMGYLRNLVECGTPYIGSSAGANLACPTIKNTNDMPIVSVPSLGALSVVPFQINPHYVDPEPGSTHQGEPRNTRLLEYFKGGANTVPVVALREGCGVRVEGERASLWGATSAKIYRSANDIAELPAGTRIDDLLYRAPRT